MSDVARSLALWCPDWPVVAVGADAAREVIVVADGRVLACTAAAREAGVRRGQRLRDAQRFCPDVVVHAADPSREAGLFEQVVAQVEEIAPRIEVIRPGLLALPARGAARFHGGEAALAQLVLEAVIGQGFAGAVGVADGSFAAVLAARAAWESSDDGIRLVAAGEVSSFLAPQSIAVLERPELASVLIRLGIRTLGQLAALSAADVLVRFGAGGVAAHRLARGLLARPPATRPPGEDLAVQQEFDPPAGSSDPVVFAAKSLADQLHAVLAARGVTCVRIEIEAVTAAGRRWARLWRHDGLLSALAVAERVRWQLDGWRTEASKGRAGDAGRTGADPIVLLRLAPDHLVTDTGTQLGLWGREETSDAVARAATRLQAMLGHAAVTTAVLAGGRGPGERVLKVPWGDLAEPDQPADGRWPGRLPDPLPSVVPQRDMAVVQVLDRDGRAVLVSGRGELSAEPSMIVEAGVGQEALSGMPPGLSVGDFSAGGTRVTGWVGPWPTVERWWDRSASRRLARFQCTTDDGRAWLLVVEKGQWWVEGRYV